MTSRGTHPKEQVESSDSEHNREEKKKNAVGGPIKSIFKVLKYPEDRRAKSPLNGADDLYARR